MLTLHVVICFIALLGGALVLIALCSGRHQPTWAALLLISTALISWRRIYVVAIVSTVYFNVFVAVTQAFLKVGSLHAFAPTGKEPPFLVAQLLTLVLFVVIGVSALGRFRGDLSQIAPAA